MYRSVLSAVAFVLTAVPALAQPVLNAATLPNSRAVAVNSPATIFASVINSGDAIATNCRVALEIGAPAALSISYAPADGNGNISGPADTPVPIGIGATQQFLVAVSASSAFSGNVPLTYVCDNGQALSVTALNDLALRATTPAGPDIITIASTLTGDGIMNTNANGRGVISIAAINIGSATAVADRGIDVPAANEATITVIPVLTNFSDGAQHPLSVCQTNALAQCLTGYTATVTTQIGDSAVTFNVRLSQITGVGVPFLPEAYRLRVEFRDANNNLVGATSVAPRSPSPTVPEIVPHGFWDFFVRDNSDPGGSFLRSGRIFFPPDGSPPSGGVQRGSGAQAYIQPVVLVGQFANGRFTGCMRFLDTGRGDAAFPGISLNVTTRHFIRGTYDSASQDACPPAAGSGIDRPAINPRFSAGLLLGTYINLAEDDGMDPAMVDWTVRNPIDENDDYGMVSMSSISGSFSFSGTYRSCTLTGTGSRYNANSPSFGTRLAFTVTYTLANCESGTPAFLENDFTGFFVIPEMRDGQTQTEGFQAIFTDGFESGDTSAWSATIP